MTPPETKSAANFCKFAIGAEVPKPARPVRGYHEQIFRISNLHLRYRSRSCITFHTTTNEEQWLRRLPGADIPTMLRLLRTERLAWALAAFYFLTFGGFVALSVYLPLLLRDQFRLTLGDAGFRTAGFVAVAAGMRPVGGWLADRIGGARVLWGVFAGIVPFALVMSSASILPFSVGAIRMRSPAWIGKRRRVQTCPAIFPERPQGYRTHRVRAQSCRPNPEYYAQSFPT